MSHAGLIIILQEREASLVSRDVLELEVRRLRGLTLSRADDVAQAELANEQARLELEESLSQIQVKPAADIVHHNYPKIDLAEGDCWHANAGT